MLLLLLTVHPTHKQCTRSDLNYLFIDRLIILVQDASLTWTTPVELTAANCPPLVLDAAGFKMMVCQSEQVLSGAARLWRLDGG
jgi:hypothetical protein